MIARMPLLYGAVAGTCLLLHNAILIAADRERLPLLAGVILSFCTVAIMGYLLHSWLTFRETIGLARFARYALAMAGNIPLAFAATWLWRDGVGLPMVAAAPIASACMVAVNFALSRWAISGPRRAPGR